MDYEVYKNNFWSRQSAFDDSSDNEDGDGENGLLLSVYSSKVLFKGPHREYVYLERIWRKLCSAPFRCPSLS